MEYKGRKIFKYKEKSTPPLKLICPNFCILKNLIFKLQNRVIKYQKVNNNNQIEWNTKKNMLRENKENKSALRKFNLITCLT